MPNYTPTFNLVKPVGPEQFNVSHANENADKLDAAVMKKDGSNSNLAYLNFTNGSQLIVDTNKNILNMVFPDGTTANIPSEFWFSEGKYTGTIAEGDNVMFAGSQGDYYLLKKAVASELAANPHLYAGVATKAGAANTWGKVTKIGLVNGINTSAWPFGTRIYFDPVTLGFTPTLPTLPNARIGVGMVVKQGTANGIILVDNYNVGAYTKTELDSLFATKALKPTNEATATNGQILTANGDGTSTYKNLLMPKNWIINGMFDVWQRSTSNTFNGNAGFVFPSVDRFMLWSNSSTALNTSQRMEFDIADTTVPNNPKYYHRLTANSIAGGQVYIVMNHTIEDMRKLAGKTMTISFWIKSNNGSDAQVGWGNSVTDITETKVFTTTSTWTKKTYTFTLQTVSGSNNANSYTKIQFRFFTPVDGTTFDIANISLVEGSVAVECQNQPYADVLRECQRYYQRLQASSFYGYGNTNSTTSAYFLINHKVNMRVAPTGVEFNSLVLSRVGESSVAITTTAVTMAGMEASLITCGGTGFPVAWSSVALNGSGGTSYLAFNAELL